MGYRESGYSPDYLAEHKPDIVIHRAANKAFDDLGVKKLPTMKSIQIEFSNLLAGKKQAYAELRKVRSEHRQLSVHKAICEKLLSLESQRTETEHGPR